MKFLLAICCVLWSLYKCVGSETPARDYDSNKMKSSDQNGALTQSGTDRCLVNATEEFEEKAPMNANLSDQKTVQAWCVVVTKYSDCIWKNGVDYNAESERVLNASLLNKETWDDYHRKSEGSNCACIDRVADDYISRVSCIPIRNANDSLKRQLDCIFMNKMHHCVLDTQDCGPNVPCFKIVELWAKKIGLFDGKYDKMGIGSAYKEYCSKEPLQEKYPVDAICPSMVGSKWNIKNILLVAGLSLVGLAVATSLLFILYQIAMRNKGSKSYTRVESASIQYNSTTTL